MELTEPRLPDTLVGEFARRIEERLGLVFPERRHDELRRYLRVYAREEGIDDLTAHLTQGLFDGGASVHWDRLATHVTVGETYFFRDAGAMSALETEILPALIERGRARGRRLRIWSAACGTGEEAYTIAILLDRLLPQQHGWQIDLIASDVNQTSLARARDAVYRPWSLRETPDWARLTYFSQREDGRFELAAKLLPRVRFLSHNLAQPPWSLALFGAMDLILCRNVLIYFGPERVRSAFAELRRCLDPEGHLIVSPSELGVEPAEGFYVEHHDPGFSLRLEGAAPLASHRAPAAARPVRRDRPAPRPAPKPAPSSPATEPVPVRAAVDAASLPQDDPVWALEDCRRALLERPLDAALHYVHAALLEESGDLVDADDALRRALYVDPDFVLAHYLRGSVLARLGREIGARRHFARAIELALALPEDASVPFAVGMRPKVLAEVISAAAHRTGCAR